jgi:hypothetical protein
MKEDTGGFPPDLAFLLLSLASGKLGFYNTRPS